MTLDEQLTPTAVFYEDVHGLWSWSVETSGHRFLADSSYGRATRLESMGDAVGVIEALLRADCPETELAVARWLGTLDRSAYVAVLENSAEWRQINGLDSGTTGA